MALTQNRTSGKQYITPTYQATLHNALMHVENAFANSSLVDAWNSLKVLYDICTPKVRKVVEKDYVDIEDSMDEIMREQSVAEHIVIRELRKPRLTNSLLDRKAHALLRKMIDALDANGLLTQGKREVESNVDMTVFEDVSLAQ